MPTESRPRRTRSTRPVSARSPRRCTQTASADVAVDGEITNEIMWSATLDRDDLRSDPDRAELESDAAMCIQSGIAAPSELGDLGDGFDHRTVRGLRGSRKCHQTERVVVSLVQSDLEVLGRGVRTERGSERKVPVEGQAVAGDDRRDGGGECRSLAAHRQPNRCIGGGSTDAPLRR